MKVQALPWWVRGGLHFGVAEKSIDEVTMSARRYDVSQTVFLSDASRRDCDVCTFELLLQPLELEVGGDEEACMVKVKAEVGEVRPLRHSS